MFFRTKKAPPTIFVHRLHAEYAHRVAHVGKVDTADYPATADGLSQLCRDASANVTGYARELFSEFADDFATVSNLGVDTDEAQRLLTVADNSLFASMTGLEMELA